MATDIDIKALRKSVAITQDQLAAIVGVTTITVCRWEKGKTRPTAYQVALLKGIELAAKRSDVFKIKHILASRGPVAGLTFLLVLACKEEGSQPGGA